MFLWVTIRSPGSDGLNGTLDIYNQFVCDNCITFNSKKTVCIKFGESDNDNECVKLNDKMLKWNTDVVHLDNLINSKFDNSIDSNIKCSSFFLRNVII